MPSTIDVPPSMVVILDRIDHWKEQQEKSCCISYIQECENMINELKLVKEMVKGS